MTARDTRAEILDTALELFSRRGFAGTSLRDIADAMGFSKAALYYHFPAKGDLVLALLEPVLAGIEELVTGAGGRDKLLAAYLDFIVGQRRVIGFVLREPSALDNPVVATVQADLVGRIRDSLAGRGAGPAARVRAACALGAVHMAVLTVDPDELPAARDVILASATAALGAGR